MLSFNSEGRQISSVVVLPRMLYPEVRLERSHSKTAFQSSQKDSAASAKDKAGDANDFCILLK